MIQLKVHETAIPDVKLIEQFSAGDDRGYFVKTFMQQTLKDQGIDFAVKESIYSVSHKHVIRGMHFHHPPYAHDKLVFCITGSLLDVALDLRKESATFGQYVTAKLSAENKQALYIPKGFAHGFLCLENATTTYYFISGEYVQAADDGIRYDSFGLNWQIDSPILSARDLSFDSFDKFQSPF
ncbi:MAG: dTDP-4-dehydrorhamnose 3,5-epimerase [Chitinophagaceae bacterium]|nr:dTDP-4-dehydrorhamnose 3,5-epimerase [Chitinophagaceae bacterium]